MSGNFQKDLEKQVRHSIIYEVVDDMLLEYELKKMPIDASLHGCLEAYTKQELIQLAEQNGVDIRVSWNKGPIIDSLHTGIMNTLIERFLLLGEQNTKLLHRFSMGDFDAEDPTLEKFDFFLNVYPHSVQMGLIYSLESNNGVKMVMPLEIKESLANFMSRTEEIIKQYQAKKTAIKQIEESLQAAVHLYGVITVSRVRDLWEILYPNSDCSMDFEVFFWTMIPLIAIKHDHDFINYRLIASYRLVDPEYAKEFYYHILGKMANDYYVPSKKEIRYYAQYPFHQHSPTYKKIKRLVSKMTPDNDTLLEFIESNIQLGDPLSALIEQIQDLGLILFENDEQLYEFAELYTQLHNNTRLWENGGYTPNELFNQLADSSFNLPEGPQSPDNIIPLANYQHLADDNGQPQPTKKVGRNDPCPCGSGKKYKRCCWNK